MFSSKNIWYFVASVILITVAYLCMAFDSQPSGFGILTLWIAPPLLLIGFLMPIAGILGHDNIIFLFNLKRLWTPKAAFCGLAFIISFTTYTLTLEPTASLWDCSEFIASAYKLQVPHTPGTPLTLLLGRIFSMLAKDVQHVAWTVNLMSAFFSALSISMVYLIIIHFGSKLIPSNDVLKGRLLIIAALCGSLCLTFSDTFWYSAVEAETYGPASFFLLLIIYLILKGSDCEEPLRSRMLILIAYISGLSYCIHPMCLLVLPILPFVWIMKDKHLTIKGILLTVFAGVLLVFAINKFIAIGIFDLAFKIDFLAVNSLGLPFYSGPVIILLIGSGACYFLLLKFSRYKNYILALLFLVMGFIPYIMLFIRSDKNPPIDETNPEDLYQIRAYMNRESYPTSPLLFGPYFDANIENISTKNKAYYKTDSSYKIAGTRVEYQYDKSRETILPRIYSRDENHIEAYRQWLGLKENEKPRFIHNLQFLFTYQLGHMYLRYFMWNFAGRESDIQNSNWLRPWERLSEGQSERARNQYWMVPLLLGLVGAGLQFRKDKKSFIVNSIFFLFTGVVLALYLNSPPIEPRERDYIYVASYIAFSIWIGIGLLAIRLDRLNNIATMTITIIVGLSLPGWMFYQNLNDHDRSGRTFQIDYARAALNSCERNAVLFTGGDNDTFPLWYLQEVEGLRTDVRIVVLSYFNTDWYINQLTRKYYESQPLKLSLRPSDYRQYGINDVLYVDEQIKQSIDVKQFLSLIKGNHAALRRQGSDGDFYNIIPSRTLNLTNDIKANDLSIRVTSNYLEKNALAILDIITSNDWQRPLYFNTTSMNSLTIDLKPYLMQEGLVYRLTSTRTEKGPGVNKELTYKNLVEAPDFNNLADSQVNFNYEDYIARMVVPLRQSFNALAQAYIDEGNTTMAERV